MLCRRLLKDAELVGLFGAPHMLWDAGPVGARVGMPSLCGLGGSARGPPRLGMPGLWGLLGACGPV